MGRVDGKVALVTGGASGIGRACCIALAHEGARVVVSDLDANGGRSVVEEIAGAGGEARFARLDVTSEAEWEVAIAGVVDACSRLDVLVNNAGIALARPVTQMTLDDWRRQFAVNVEGVFLGTKHAIPAMRRGGGGSIVNISSIAGLRGNGIGLSAYSASKGAVRLFTKCTALECARDGDAIRVNSVHPGVIDTPIWEKMTPTGGPNRVDPAARLSRTAAGGELGRPEDIAAGVVFLASDEARLVNGSEFVIDGAVTAG